MMGEMWVEFCIVIRKVSLMRVSHSVLNCAVGEVTSAVSRTAAIPTGCCEGQRWVSLFPVRGSIWLWIWS